MKGVIIPPLFFFSSCCCNDDQRTAPRTVARERSVRSPASKLTTSMNVNIPTRVLQCHRRVSCTSAGTSAATPSSNTTAPSRVSKLTLYDIPVSNHGARVGSAAWPMLAYTS